MSAPNPRLSDAAIPEGAAAPKGPFSIRICAGCGEQINDGHHGHGWKGKGLLTPVYEIPLPDLADLVHVDEVTGAEMRLAHLLEAAERTCWRLDAPNYLRDAVEVVQNGERS